MQKKLIYKAFGILFLTTVMFSCVEKFWPELNANSSRVLVVDGTITNLPGPYTIKLSYTSSVDSIAHFPATNFTVVISDNIGNSELLQEVDEGEYATSENGIQGHIGRKYKIELSAPNGSSYASNFVELPAPVNIQSFYAKIENKATIENELGQVGYQFYIDTEVITNDSIYFLWKLDQTYEYHSDYTADLIMEAKDTNFILRETTIEEAKGYFTCWQSDEVSQVFTYNPSILNTSNINQFPLNYVNTDTRELSVRYSLLVRQYNIDLNAYHFWNSIEKMNSNQGSMYTRQPYQIQSNVVNLNEPNEVVLGYFMVAGADEKRIFVNRLPRSYEYFYDICVPGDADGARTANFWEHLPPNGPDYDKLFTRYGMGYGTILPPVTCIDCTLKGGTNIKPDFWIDE